ncbi:phosphate signaling complex protein PhoU [Youngiibacter multivorans]|uniref:Phosphate-specific transport system accessory protein PhoU n=1 Tax=Youngiibacter multivorans TaxID=937251 RepID=A0ABS4G3H5_9CLOT|nr:phosphate signaling complex protein PhoU [Youngiibacter multivorans]MBP1919084.1 phosphate transport system protein [Youngiibacter multivorans]
MRKRFDQELEILNAEIIKMGSLIETAIETSVNALVDQDMSLIEIVNNLEIEIDEMEKIIEKHCMNLLVQQQPVASDLRLIEAALKLITDMERIGDHAEDIAEITKLFENKKFIKNLVHIPQMAEVTISMVKRSLAAYVNKDEKLAIQVCIDDDIVDNLFVTVKTELIDMIREDSNNGEQAIDLIMIAKYFERIGDHAQNIAEWVIFSVTGEHKNTDNIGKTIQAGSFAE